MKLYELSNEYLTLDAQLDAAQDDAEREAILDTLKGIEAAIEDKAENIGRLVLSYDADADAIKAEIDRLTARRKATENKAAWLKAYLLTELTVCGKEKIKSPVVTVAVRLNPPSVKVLDEQAIPADYWRIIPETKEVDKKAIIKAVNEDGEIIPGVEVERKRRLEVR